VECIADTHVHIYPAFQEDRLVRSGMQHLRRLSGSGDSMLAFCLTESAGCNYFQALEEGLHGMPANFRVIPADEKGAVRLDVDEESLWVFAGRQVVAAERVEIHSLLCPALIPDGLPAAEIIALTLKAGGVPVLAWAPGKWMFRRARVVKQLLSDFGPDALLLGDSSLRPLGWPQPASMRHRKTLAGSDPLPFAGEETQTGRYATRLLVDFDAHAPVTALRQALLDPSIGSERVGQRNSLSGVLSRMRRHRAVKQRPAV
jgi:hypothetical protein